MKITSIGSGSSGNCIVVNNELLLDCGISPKAVLPQMDFNIPKVILLTHAHQDHSKYCKDWAKRSVPIYASQGELNALSFKGYPYNPIKANEWYTVEDYEIYPFKAMHDTAEPLGFIIDTQQGERLVYSTDSKGTVQNLQGVTHLITECNYHFPILQENVNNGKLNKALAQRITETHRSLDQLIYELERMDKSNLQKIYLSHLSDRNSDEKLFKEVIQRVTGCEVYVL